MDVLKADFDIFSFFGAQSALHFARGSIAKLRI